MRAHCRTEAHGMIDLKGPCDHGALDLLGPFCQGMLDQGPFSGPYFRALAGPFCRAENWEQKIRETAIISPKGGGCLDGVPGSPRCTLQVTL